MEKFNIWKAVGYRFGRGFLSGSVGAMVAVNAAGVNTFTDVKVFAASLGIAAVMGGISGALLAVDKLIRSLKDA